MTKATGSKSSTSNFNLDNDLKNRNSEKKHMYQPVNKNGREEEGEESYELESRTMEFDDNDKPIEIKSDWHSLEKDKYNILLLCILYLLQGIPFGLCFGSIPFLLKEKLSYSELALFSLTGYPYSLKLLWSPIVDSLYFKKLGRRKTWIVPIQLCSSLLLYWLGHHMDEFLVGKHPDIKMLTILFSATVFLSATQDIAVDGWALTLLSPENLSYASTCQTIGINTGYFLSFTIFLALNSVEFSNKFLRSVPQDVGVITLSGFLTFWAFFYFVVTVYLAIFKTEAPEIEADVLSVGETYKTIIDILRLPHIRRLVLILLISKIGFICNDAVTGLKLIELGFKKEDLALTVLIDFPFQLVFGFYAARWSNGDRPLTPWLYAAYGRLAFSFLSTFVVLGFPTGEVTSGYVALVVLFGVVSSFFSTVFFVSMSAFFNQIADPYIGGTYMTFLNTLSNLGGTWPKYFVLQAVDYFTSAHCSKPGVDGNYFSCVSDTGKEMCKDMEGTCIIDKDGFYSVNILCVSIGLLILVGFVIKQIRVLEVISPTKWKIQRS